MTIATVNGIALHYERAGSGETLVLVHGSWLDARTFGRLVPLLTPCFDVIVYDRRGHSRSGGGEGQGSVCEDVEDLAALIEQLGGGRAHVAGASLGASIALRLAATRPELLLSIAAHEPPIFDSLDPEELEPGEREALGSLRLRLEEVAGRLAAGDDEGATRLYFDSVARAPGGWDAIEPERRRALLCNARTYLDQCRDPEALRVDLDELGAYSGPALITHGDRRPSIFRRMAEMAAAGLPGARTALLPGTAHDPQASSPEAYSAALVSIGRGTVSR